MFAQCHSPEETILKILLIGIIGVQTMPAFAQPPIPQWIEESWRNAHYPSTEWYTGFARDNTKGQPNSDAYQAVEKEAQKRLIENINVRISGTSTTETKMASTQSGKNSSETIDQNYASKIRVSSDAELAKAETRSHYDAKSNVIYAFAFVRKSDLADYYASRIEFYLNEARHGIDFSKQLLELGKRKEAQEKLDGSKKFIDSTAYYRSLLATVDAKRPQSERVSELLNEIAAIQAGDAAIRLAVLEPEGKGISEEDQWMLSLVQSSITGDFNKFSNMTIIDRQNIEKVFEELKETSGNYSDEDRIKIGNLANASHILSGTISKTANAFMLELSVTDLKSGERKASYSPTPVSPLAIENLSAIKEASAELLKQLGINLTSEALAELKKEANTARIQAETALARGIMAQRQGTEVAALSYFYQAAALDPSLLEAAGRSSIMQTNISSGNIGADARNDIAWRRDWVARLTEAERFFDNLFKKNSLPYTLFYSTKIMPGNINYQTETQSLSINTNLHASGWIWLSSVEKALQALYDGLDATKRKKDWGLENWPWSGVTELKLFEKKSKTFSIAAELVNSSGKVIGRANFESRGEWGFTKVCCPLRSPEIWVSSDDRKQIKFADVKADDITDRITIRIASVNDIDAKTAAKTGVLQIKAISEAEWDGHALFKMERGGITGYNGGSGELAIPDSIWGEPIVSIGAGAFRYRNITSITIGKNISIHENAFDNKFSEFYNNNYSKYGRLRERIAGSYRYGDGRWVLLMADDAAEKEMEEIEEKRAEEMWKKEMRKKEKEEKQAVEMRKAEWEAYVAKRENYMEEMNAEIRAAWYSSLFLGIGGSLMMNSIDSLYFGHGYGIHISGGGEFFKGHSDFFRIGFNIELGGILVDVKAIEKKYPYADSIKADESESLFKIDAFVRLYPLNSWYLHGGAGLGYYSGYSAKTENGDKLMEKPWALAPILSAGTGVLFADLSRNRNLILEARYDMLPFSGYAGYVSITFGVKMLNNNKYCLIKPTHSACSKPDTPD